MKFINALLFYFVYSYICLTSIPVLAQPAFTPSQVRIESMQQRDLLRENSLIKKVKFNNIGPTVMSGRVVDLAVNELDPSQFYIAYASGGLWKTSSNGIDMEPLFQYEASMTIGDIAVDWKNGETIWLGSGENNSSRSSYAGTGIYKSTDKGKTWQFLGLAETHHIGRIILHPENPDIVWVAALGHLYSSNKERGIYKTTDGGKSWKKVLYINEKTGVVDLTIDPSNPLILYAASWERERSAWNFTGAGDGSGIYKSIDGGENWKKINTGKNGFPSNEGVGRIGLDISRSNSNIIYAILDNQNRRPKTETEVYVVTKELLSKIDRESFLELSDLEINNYLNRNNFPQQYNATDIKKAVETKKITPNTLVEYLQDANAALFDTPVIGAEIYKSEDAGKTWEKMNKDYLDGVYNSYGYYFGQIRISPQNPDKIYTFGVPVIKSADSGKSWESINGGNVHVDHHALWLNPQKKGHLILGNDGGVNISYDDGNTWIKCNNAALGQFYAVNVDMETPYNVYGGLQDNGVWMGPHNNVTNNNWQMEGAYPFQELLGGDGMQVAIDTRDNNIVYTGFQFGYYYRIYKNTGEKKLIQPKHKLGERPLRFNWQVPIHLSKHNQDILYLGSNKFHRSFNKGDDFEALSGDLTKGGKKGNVPYGTLTDIHESPLKFGLIYTGTDDGLVHVSKDGGYTWENISNGLPKDMWISRVTASAFKESRVYVSLNGYRFDNFSAMVFVSEDYGKTWQSIGNDLPAEPVNVIIEDTENNNLLYVGTDHGLYISLNRGKSFMAAGKSIPNVPIHDLVIHPREHHLIVGTHGRSIYVGDISEIQQLTTEVTSKEIDIFAIDNMKYSKQWGNEKGYAWRGYHEPKLLMPFYSKNAGEVTITIVSEKEQILKTERVNAVKGLNYFEYDLSIERKEIEKYKIDFNTLFTSSEIEMNKKKNGKFYLVPSTYVLQIKINDHSATQKFVIEPPKKQSERKPTQKTP